MKRAFCYLPILRAKQGEFSAVQALSPDARSRLVPLFDLPVPLLGNGVKLEDYVTECANGIHASWGRGRQVYVDVHDFPLDLRTQTGTQPIAYLFDLLRDRGVEAIPATGTIADRGSDYVAGVREIAARDGRGACVRLAQEDFLEPQRLEGVVDATLVQLGIGAAETDVILDLRCINGRHIEQLRATVLEALRALTHAGSFRNLAVVGGSVPEGLGKRDVGKVRRVSRSECLVWNQLSDALDTQMAVSFGDYGVIHAHFVPPNKGVRVPPRIRYTTSNEHAFYRGALGSDYADLCQQVVSSYEFSGPNFSDGDRTIALCAQGLDGPGNASSWVASDTSHHLEFVSRQVWQTLRDSDRLTAFLLPEPERHPWLQPALVIDERPRS